jgi:hypothetical protein
MGTSGKGWFHQLIADAKAVWSSPGVKRPITERWMNNPEYLNDDGSLKEQDRTAKEVGFPQSKKTRHKD